MPAALVCAAARDKHDVEQPDEACRIGNGNAWRVNGAQRNGSAESTARHKTKASEDCGTPLRVGMVIILQRIGNNFGYCQKFVMHSILFCKTKALMPL